MPQISNMGLVLTVYPVTDNKPDFKNGRFLGNDLRPASRVSWSENNSGKAVLTELSKDYTTDKEILFISDAKLRQITLGSNFCHGFQLGLLRQGADHATETEKRLEVVAMARKKRAFRCERPAQRGVMFCRMVRRDVFPQAQW